MKKLVMSVAAGCLPVALILLALVQPEGFTAPGARADDAQTAAAQADAVSGADMDDAGADADGDNHGESGTDPAESIVKTEGADTEDTAVETPSVYYSTDDASLNAYNGTPFIETDASYFEDALFIGNSRMRGFVLYAEIPDLNSLTYIGWLVGEFFTSPVIYMYGQPVTGADAVKQTTFQKVYLNFGFNDLMFDDEDAFVRDYRLIVDYVSEYQPEAVIFINSILPVHPQALYEYPYAEQERVDRYNAALREMAIDAGCVYLDSRSVFLDDEGYMNMSLSWEGVHVHEQGMKYLRDYWLSHAVDL